MSTAEKRHTPLQRQLQAYAESWKSDHVAAQECFDLEERIAVGVSLASLLDRAEMAWRDRVFRGVRPASSDEDERIQPLLQFWLASSDVILSHAAELEQRFGTVEGFPDLLAATQKARAHLASWSPPKPSAAVGLRDQTLTPDEAKELDAILGRPAPPVPQRRFETKDSSFYQ